MKIVAGYPLTPPEEPCRLTCLTCGEWRFAIDLAARVATIRCSGGRDHEVSQVPVVGTPDKEFLVRLKRNTEIHKAALDRLSE